MLIVFMMASIVGGVLMALLVGLSEHSLLVALLTAPIGGSLFVVMVALLQAARTEPRGISTLSRRGRFDVPRGVVWG